MNNSVVLTVTQLNKYIKSNFDADQNLINVFLSGEISNFTNHYRTGHFYFTLKDDNSAVRAVMFRGNAERIKFMPEDGMKIIARGRVSVYEATGQYQLYVDDMQPDGIGALNLAYEQLKEKLQKEGLFDLTHKLPLPRYPNRVGVITSPTGAAVQDILNVLSRRFPLAEVVFCPVLVQGESAHIQLKNAVETFNKGDFADVIIIGRGGGSIEDLWEFNSEELAYSIYNSHIPVISAVGHETDYTICDFVSDMRAPTPSAAAELAVPDSKELLYNLSGVKNRFYSLTDSEIEKKQAQLQKVMSREVLRNPLSPINNLSLKLDYSVSEMCSGFTKTVRDNKERFLKLSAAMSALNPMSVLLRGYSFVSDENGKNILSVKQIKQGAKIDVRFSDGNAECTVKEIK